jgi:Sulfotransferase family
MIVSHAKRFIFLHVPKCAGTSFRDALKAYHDDAENFWYRRNDPYFGCEVDYAHMRLWELHALFPRIFDAMAHYETLALVRNPYERFISALAQHLTAFHQNLDYYAADKEILRGYAERFIEQELRIERVLGNARFVHFSFQTWYIALGELRLARHVLPIPNNDQGWAQVFGKLGVPPAPIGRSNPRGGPLSHLLRNEGMLQWIENFYRSDFDWLRRDPNLAALTVRPKP